MAVVFTRVTSQEEVSQILDLQTLNLSTAITPEVAQAEGFLTVRHDPEVLWRMNRAEPSIIAKMGNNVIGYALVMLPHFVDDVPRDPTNPIPDSKFFKIEFIASDLMKVSCQNKEK